MTPHAYFRTAAGGLAETYLAGSGWVTQPLPGQPGGRAARSWRPPRPAATRRCSSPIPAGHLAESAGQGGGWADPHAARSAPAASPGAIALAATASGLRIFSAGRTGTLTVTTPDRHRLAGHPDSPARAAPGSWLTAVTTPARARRGSCSAAVTAHWPTSPRPGPASGGRASCPARPPPGSVAGGHELPARCRRYRARSARRCSTSPRAGQPAVSYSDRPGLADRGAAAGGQRRHRRRRAPTRWPAQPVAAVPGRRGRGAAGRQQQRWQARAVEPGRPAPPRTRRCRTGWCCTRPPRPTRPARSAPPQAAGLPASQVTQSFATAWDAPLRRQLPGHLGRAGGHGRAVLQRLRLGQPVRRHPGLDAVLHRERAA